MTCTQQPTPPRLNLNFLDVTTILLYPITPNCRSPAGTKMRTAVALFSTSSPATFSVLFRSLNIERTRFNAMDQATG
ncbi:hypothetical protein C8R43DRAFT_968462 [Mycena crocata]|nr:hypothetical protein C8R43DRAFT_968462 [Mycena crocata]